MSGFEAMTAILGIAGMGVQVSATLYDFADTVAGAKEDMHMIAESIDTYSSVLETLGRQLEVSQAVCSVEGLKLAQDLHRQSEVLFTKIAENIPKRSENTSMRQKVAWYFKRERVNFLLGQIEQLKATVSLLLQILILAQTAQPKTNNNTTTINNNTTTTTNNIHNNVNNINIHVNVVNAEINSQFRRAENRVMQYHNASVKFANLQIEDEEPVVRNALPWKEEFEELPVVRQRDNDDDIAASFGRLVLRQPRMAMATAASTNTRADSAQLVNVLLDHWTTLETQPESDAVSADRSPIFSTSPVDRAPTFPTSSADRPPTFETAQVASINPPVVNEPRLIDPMSRTDTFIEDTTIGTESVDKPSQLATTSAAATTTITTTATNSSNPIKGWWQKYRQSQKSNREEEERQKELDNQERALQRRETQLQREQTLVERELRLQEKQKEQEAAKAKAIAEREVRLQESQRLKEAAQKQALAEKELRAQEDQKQREARRDHAARLREIRKRPTAVVRNGSDNYNGGVSRVSTTGSLGLNDNIINTYTTTNTTDTTTNTTNTADNVNFNANVGSGSPGLLQQIQQQHAALPQLQLHRLLDRSQRSSTSPSPVASPVASPITPPLSSVTRLISPPPSTQHQQQQLQQYNSNYSQNSHESPSTSTPSHYNQYQPQQQQRQNEFETETNNTPAPPYFPPPPPSSTSTSPLPRGGGGRGNGPISTISSTGVDVLATTLRDAKEARKQRKADRKKFNHHPHHRKGGKINNNTNNVDDNSSQYS